MVETRRRKQKDKKRVARVSKEAEKLKKQREKNQRKRGHATKSVMDVDASALSTFYMPMRIRFGSARVPAGKPSERTCTCRASGG